MCRRAGRASPDVVAYRWEQRHGLLGCCTFAAGEACPSLLGGLAGYDTCLPRLREHWVLQGRKVETQPALFPGYAFVLIHLQWHSARWAPGTLGLIMDGIQPARVPDGVIADLRSRERNGLSPRR
jgi:hypothetical protein